jgi:hypothetical protein
MSADLMTKSHEEIVVELRELQVLRTVRCACSPLVSRLRI